jgi:hypothetical protein
MIDLINSKISYSKRSLNDIDQQTRRFRSSWQRPQKALKNFTESVNEFENLV